MLALAFCGAWLSADASVQAAESPTVILITVDTLRADRTSPYGYAAAETPTLDTLAADGVTFENAIVQVPMTLPSHASIFTATYPMFHGLRDVVGRLDPTLPTLTEWFSERGYATGAFVGASVLSAAWGLDRGFDHYDDEFSAPAGGRVDLDRVERPAEVVVSSALEWIGRQQDGPFFAWIHLFDPHDPSTPPEPFASRFRQRPYDGEIAYVDSQLARLVQALKASGRYRDSLIVFTADHGEMLGEHDEKYHAFFVYEAALRVPLIFKLPGGRLGSRPLEGARVSNQVRSVDIAPTMIQALGEAVPSWAQGESLVGFMLGRRGQTHLPAYAETHYPRIHFGWSPLFSLSNGQYKFISAPTPELYDLAADPGETRNLAPRNRSLANRLEAELKALTGRFGSEAALEEGGEVDSRTLEQLQALGYVGFSSGAGDEDWSALADPKEKIGVYNRLNQAISLSREGRRQQAVRLLADVARSEPEMPIVHFLLGTEYMQLEQYLKAIQEFKLTLERNPASSPARFNLAQAYSRAGLAEPAAREARELIASDPDHFGARHLLATLLVRSGQLEEAVREEQRVVQLSPDFVDGYNNLGAYLFSLGRIEEAAEAYRRALEHAAHHVQARVNLSLAYLRLAQYEKALEEAGRAVQLEPRASLAHFYMGQAYAALGRQDEARSAFARAKQLNPSLEVPGS